MRDLYIFSPILVCCLFILLMASFAVQKSLVQCSPTCLFLLLLPLLLVSNPKIIIALPVSKSLPPVFSSRGFKISGLRFKILVHVELVFVHGVKCHSLSFFCILLHVDIQFSNTIYWRDYSLPHSWLLFQKLIDHICIGLFLGSLFCSINLCDWF